MKFSATNVDLIFSEYPFLIRYVDQWLWGINVKLIGLDLMREVPLTRNCIISGSGLEPEAYHILDKNCAEIASVRQSGWVRIGKFSLWSPRTWFRTYVAGERVGDAVERLDDPNRIAYIVELRRKVGGEYEGDYPERSFITLHKLPRKTSFSGHISRLQEEVKKKFRE